MLMDLNVHSAPVLEIHRSCLTRANSEKGSIASPKAGISSYAGAYRGRARIPEDYGRQSHKHARSL
ncbi:hypothetical protein D3Y55_18340 [Mesorhizobium sp. DCY119]|nr:hypothetical protein D3Y55_18340 [Mesorhizobium sp. DCY119]